MTANILLFIIIISCLMLGTVEIWSQTAVLFMVYTLGLLWVLRREYDGAALTRPERLVLAAGAGLLLYGVLQLIPLPHFFLKLIAPSSFGMHTFYSFDGSGPVSISLDTYRSGVELMRVFSFFIIFVISFYNFRDRDTLRRALTTLVVFGFCLSLFGIIQQAAGNGKIYWFRELTLGGSPFGPFVNRNHFAGFMNMLIPLGLGLALTRRSREKKALFGFFTVIMTIAAFFSLSRGGVVAFSSGMTLFSILLVASRVQTKRLWAVGFFLIVVASYLVYLGMDPIIARFHQTDVTREQRLLVWSATWTAIRDFWSTGSGFGTFMNVFLLYAPDSIRLIYDHAHNDYLEFILETGLIGLLLLLLLVGLSVSLLVKSGLRGRTGILRISAVSSVFTMAVHSVFDFNLHILSNGLLFAAICGMMIALTGAETDRRNDEGEEKEIVTERRARRRRVRSEVSRPAADEKKGEPTVRDQKDRAGTEDWEKELRK